MSPPPSPERPGGLLDFPSKIQIQTINRCNYTCPMCPYPEVSTGQRGTQLDSALFYRLLDEVGQARRRVKLCLMLQNEPLLDKRFVQFLEHAHNRVDAVSSVSTVTNGSVLDEELLDKLMGFERLFLTISVNATDRERYQRVHGRDLWDRVHGLLERWKGPRHRVRLSFVLDSGSVEEGKKFRTYWRGKGYGARFVPINARVDTKSDTPRMHEVDELYGHCHYPVDTLNVLADGSVILCCNDWLHTERFGNLHQSSLAEVWNSPALLRLRQAALDGTLRDNPMCKACDYPVRSSQRVQLEALVAEDASPLAGGGDRPLVSHGSSLRLTANGRSMPVWVWSVDEEAGAVSAFVPRSLGALPPEVWFELRIGHSGAFNFGALEPVWCQGRPTPLASDVEFEDAVPVRIQLATGSEAFQFFRWYCADWRAT